MGLFFVAGQMAPRGSPSAELLHRLECRACPLANCANNKHSNMEPTGSRAPLIYILGEAPGREEDREGRQFVGAAGQFLRDSFGASWFADPDGERKTSPAIRWNNVVRTRPPNNRTPTFVEIEACRPSVVRDIEKHRPPILVLVGNTSLQWATGQSQIGAWRGRRVPVRVGSHVCWGYPVHHTSYLIRQGGEGADVEMFYKDIARIERDAERAAAGELPAPPFVAPETALDDIDYVLGNGADDLSRVLEKLDHYGRLRSISLDLETASSERITTRQIRPYGRGARILSVALSGGPQDTFAFPLSHSGARWRRQEREQIDKKLHWLLTRASLRKVCFNSAFELEWLSHFYGSEILRLGEWEDTMCQAFVLDERQPVLSLGAQCVATFGLPLKSLSRLDRSRLDDSPLEEVLLYNGGDAKFTRVLFKELSRQLVAEGLQEVYAQRNGRSPTLVASQALGIRISFAANRRTARRFKRRLLRIERQLRKDKWVRRYRDRTGREFVPSRNREVAYLLDKIMGRGKDLLVEGERGKLKVSTDDNVLAKIGEPVAELLRDWRECSKARSTYIDGFSRDGEAVYPDGLIHTQYNHLLTRTGRLSSDSPNMQNFPIRTAEGKFLRNQIVARRHHVLVAIDYGQIEARVIAMASCDKVLVKALWDNYDIHMDWALKLARLEPRLVGGKAGLKDKDALKKLRQDVKNNWVFPAFYGATLNSVAGYLKIEPSRLAPLFEEFWDRFRGVARWQKRLIAFYERHGYVECLTGLRRHGPMYRNKIINSPIQGTASELVMDAMDRLSLLAHRRRDVWLQPIMNVHDDLTFDVPKKQVTDYLEIVIPEMLRVEYDFINVPIVAEVSIGYRWGDKREIAKFSSNTWKAGHARKLAHEIQTEDL